MKKEKNEKKVCPVNPEGVKQYGSNVVRGTIHFDAKCQR